MKVTIFILASALILFLLTSPALSSRNTPEEDEVVYDTLGNPLEIGATYTINIGRFKMASGFIGLWSQHNETCEQDVIPLGVNNIYPGPGRFSFTPTSGEAIKLRSPVAIQSPAKNPCGESTIWKVTDRMGKPIITTGGYFNTPNTCLRIVKPLVATSSTNSYGLEHCPNMCGAGVKLCYYIGISLNNEGNDHLSPGGDIPLEFVLSRTSLDDQK